MKKLTQPNDSVRTQVNKAKMLRHLKLNMGNVRKSCKSSDVKKSTFYDWCKNDNEFRKATTNIYRASEEIAIDIVMEQIGDDISALLKVQRSNAKKLIKFL